MLQIRLKIYSTVNITIYEYVHNELFAYFYIFPTFLLSEIKSKFKLQLVAVGSARVKSMLRNVRLAAIWR